MDNRNRTEAAPKMFFRLQVKRNVADKFQDYVNRGRIPLGSKFDRLLWRSDGLEISPEARAAIIWNFDLLPDSNIWLRICRVSSSFSLLIIGCGTEVIELGGYRTLRRLGRRWLKALRKVSPRGFPKGRRLEEIFKFRWAIKIQGGLLKQEKQPRNRWPDRRQKMEYEIIEHAALP